MNNNRADLHIHTTASDGMASPEEIIDMAVSSSLSYISFTDHDCVDAYSEAVFCYAESKGLRLITGLELGCRRKEKDVHILGYFIDVKNQTLHDTLAGLRAQRALRCHSILDKLKKHQINISYEEVWHLTHGSIGRAHIARAMVMKGYVSNIKEAFELYLGDGCKCYVEKEGLSVEEAIALIKQCKGISILAHPKLIGSDEIIREVINAGVQGIEVYHSKHNTSDELYYSKLADENGLIITGGSDFHGKYTNDHLGNYVLNAQFIQKIKNS